MTERVSAIYVRAFSIVTPYRGIIKANKTHDTHVKGWAMYYGKLLRQIAETIQNLANRSDALCREIGEKIKDHAAAIRDASEANKQSQNVEQEWSKKVFAANQKSEGDRASREQESNGHQKSIKYATWCAFIAAAIYAGIAARQLKTMQRQLKDSEEATRFATKVEIESKKPLIVVAAESYHLTPTKDGVKVNLSPYSMGETAAYYPQIQWGISKEPPPSATPYMWQITVWKEFYLPNGTPLNWSDKREIPKSVFNNPPFYVYGVIQYLDIFPVSTDHPRRDHRLQWAIRVEHTYLPIGRPWDGVLIKQCVDEGCGAAYRDNKYKPENYDCSATESHDATP
jgi:hypothetical protein